MTTLKELRAKQRSRSLDTVRIEKWDTEFGIRDLPAKRGVNILKRLESTPKDESGQIEVTEDAAELIIGVCAASLVNESGEAIFDCEDGREILGELSLKDLAAVFGKVGASLGLTEKKVPSLTMPDIQFEDNSAPKT